MRQDGVDLRGSGLHELVSGQADGAAGVGHVVNLVQIVHLFKPVSFSITTVNYLFTRRVLGTGDSC